MDKQFSSEAERVLELAEKEARSLNHHWVGTEHLLLGIMRRIEEGESGAGLRALSRSLPPSIGSPAIRDKVLERVSPKLEIDDSYIRNVMSLSPRMERVLKRAEKLCTQDGRGLPDTGDLILGMFWESGGIGDQILGEFGVTPRRMIDKMIEEGALKNDIDPEAVPKVQVEHRYGAEITVAEEDLGILLDELPKLLPPDTPLVFNISPEDGLAWIAVGEGFDLEDYVRRVLAQESS